VRSGVWVGMPGWGRPEDRVQAAVLSGGRAACCGRAEGPGMVLVAAECWQGVGELVAEWLHSGVWVDMPVWGTPEGWVRAAVRSEGPPAGCGRAAVPGVVLVAAE